MANTAIALDEVNHIRLAAGREPVAQIPRGIKGSACDCPVARALKDVIPAVNVTTTTISGRSFPRAAVVASVTGGDVSGDVVHLNTSPHIAEFVKDFDAGRLNQYVA